MTICVSVKVSEGIVIASDSAATITTSGDMAKNIPPTVLKTYDHARKLSHIKDYPIGTLSWGTYLLGARSVESLIKEYEYTLPSLQEQEENSEKEGEIYTYTVENIARGLFDHIKKFYDSVYPDQNFQPDLGILVCGYSSHEYFPDQWLLSISNYPNMIKIRGDNNGKPDFGANWFGAYDALVRLHHGCDDLVIKNVIDRFKITQEDAMTLLQGIEYHVIFDGMPLQDAIDYATYLINVVIGRFRFVIGAPVCGGEIDVAVIKPNSFTWVQRKTWKSNSPSKC